jgi:hypothetical protein
MGGADGGHGGKGQDDVAQRAMFDDEDIHISNSA